MRGSDFGLEVTGLVRRRISAVRMGRFAINRSRQGQGWGAELLREAPLSAVTGGKLIGARVMLVDAISDEARDFYVRFGSMPSPVHLRQVLYALRIVAASTGRSSRSRASLRS